ncbi:hypothetical protein RISK_006120 [Rhodopirellula islandica]|uniref:Uncharacterized protein n=1 Tax=Rhodopirellula islandica TaxID=595434 RepID=A0A0J1B660_RHOIS|nr:hypothetical protein RISK_006120 [Rhodopirellula islandica]
MPVAGLVVNLRETGRTGGLKGSPSVNSASHSLEPLQTERFAGLGPVNWGIF